MIPGQVEIAPLRRQADFVPTSLNPDSRTVDVVFSTGAAVLRQSFFDGPWIEVLSLKPSAVKLDRLNAGAPFLAAHDTSGLDKVLGVIEAGSARIEGRGDGARAVATVRFSRRPDVEPVWQDVRDGIVRNVSVGYRVHKFEESAATKDAPVTRTATLWEPFEVSAVPIGADPLAQVRGDALGASALNPCLVTRAEEVRTMEPTAVALAEIAPKTDPAPDPEPTAADRASEVETERCLGILRGCESARLPRSFAEKLIAAKVPLSEARGQILAMLDSAGTPDRGPRTGATGVAMVGSDPLENVWRGITGALLNRIDPAGFPLSEESIPYRSRSLLRCAEECLEQRGIRTRNLSKLDIARLAFEPMNFQIRQGYHTTSDFANLLADVANKTLRRAYDAAPQTFQAISRLIAIPDFKPIKRNQLGEAPALLKVLEHGEFTRGTIAEGKEQFQLATYGRIFGITRQALINDDLDAFGRLVTMFARSARNLESDVVWFQILSNPNMADGNAIFSAAHANLTATGTAIDVPGLGVGRAAMRKQTALDGATYLNIIPRYLIVPPSKETIADQYTTQITPALGSSVNPFTGRLQVIAEPRLEGGVTLDGVTVAGSGVAWYLGADPEQIDMVEYAYLDGTSGPTIEPRLGFDVDGLETKCRHDFAAKVIDWRGLYKNNGA